MHQATDADQAPDLDDDTTVQADTNEARPSAQTQESRISQWFGGRRLLDNSLATVTTLGTYGLIALGFSTSYGAIRDIAREKGHFSDGMSHVVPLSFEGGIIVLSLYAIRAAREGKRALLLEVLVALGSLATLYVNWRATAEGLEGKATHVIPVAMFLVCFKYLIHSVRRRALEAAGVLPPPLPRLRSVEWIFAPRDAFAQWRLMALHGIPTQEQALWAHHAMSLRKVQLKAKHGVKRWRHVPLHERLEMRTAVLAEAETVFSNDGRYSKLTSKLTRESTESEPARVPALSLPAQSSPAGELEIPDEQSALPSGTTTHSEQLPAVDRPYLVEDESAGAPIETSAEREARQTREHDQRRQANYDKAVEVALELASMGRPVTGIMIAQDDRVSVGQRSAERYLRKMREEGVLSSDDV
ncbi:DUF2637 domain-containing protein [Streptomyces sp. NPDC020412]|uniref:DUF2637 domain-containing protein n=1 Tax=Streptomyces sp. NPDC020412 TaxID=3365073 RepID=UPI0037A352F6